MNTLFIFNEAPTHSEKAFHGLRLAAALAARDATVRIFLFADGVQLAHPQPGPFEIAELFASLAQHQVAVGACASCLDTRGITNDLLAANVTRASLDDAAAWTASADKLLVY